MAFSVNIDIRALDNFSRIAPRVRAQIRGIGQAMTQVDSRGQQIMRNSQLRMQALQTQATGIRSQMMGIAAVAAAIVLPVRSTLNYGRSLAEISTLLDDVSGQMPAMEEAIRNVSLEFGAGRMETAAAFYQAISAGATDAASANFLLEHAGRLAVGGVASLEIATDGLTSVINAYGGDVSRAADMSDIMFTTVRLGKTRIEELSQSVGRVAPIASQAGVGFDELGAAFALVTKAGINTKEAATGIRAILNSIIRPSEDAKQVAQALGINWNLAGLEAQGLSGLMDQMVERTQGNTAVIARLIPQVEALPAALTLAANGGADFIEILAEMSNRAGATELAYQKIADTPAFELQRLAAQAEDTQLALGDSLIPVLQAVTGPMTAIVGQLGAIIQAFPLASSAIGGTIAAIVALRVAVLASKFVLIGFQMAWVGLTAVFGAAIVAIETTTAVLIHQRGVMFALGNLVWVLKVRLALLAFVQRVVAISTWAMNSATLVAIVRWGAMAIAAAALVFFMGGLGVAMLIATAATWLFNAALWANPIVWVVAAIIALVAGIIWMANNWELVATVMWETWVRIRGFIKAAVDDSLGWIADLVHAMSFIPGPLGALTSGIGTFTTERIEGPGGGGTGATGSWGGGGTPIENSARSSVAGTNNGRLDGNIAVNLGPGLQPGNSEVTTSGIADGLNVGVNME